MLKGDLNLKIFQNYLTFAQADITSLMKDLLIFDDILTYISGERHEKWVYGISKLHHIEIFYCLSKHTSLFEVHFVK